MDAWFLCWLIQQQKLSYSSQESWKCWAWLTILFQSGVMEMLGLANQHEPTYACNMHPPSRISLGFGPLQLHATGTAPPIVGCTNNAPSHLTRKEIMPLSTVFIHCFAPPGFSAFVHITNFFICLGMLSYQNGVKSIRWEQNKTYVIIISRVIEVRNK